jgi:hypothetical protein
MCSLASLEGRSWRLAVLCFPRPSGLIGCLPCSPCVDLLSSINQCLAGGTIGRSLLRQDDNIRTNVFLLPPPYYRSGDDGNELLAWVVFVGASCVLSPLRYHVPSPLFQL